MEIEKSIFIDCLAHVIYEYFYEYSPAASRGPSSDAELSSPERGGLQICDLTRN